MIHTQHQPATGLIRPLLALAMASTAAYAQTPAPEAELPPVTVSAHDSLAVPYDATGVSVTVLDLGQLKREGVTTLTDAMTTTPGAYVMPGGGTDQRGNVSNIALRGMSKATLTLPMLDGMRLFNSSGGGNITPNVLGHTNLLALGNVEVLRGAQGAVYGSGAMGGVIYMETPEGTGEPAWSTFQECGSFGTYTGNVIAQGQLDQLSYFLSATYEHTNNDIRYADNSKPVGVRHAGRFAQWSEAVRLDYRFNDKNKLTLTYHRADSGYDRASQGWAQYGIDPYSQRSNLVTAKWQTKLTDKWTSSLMAGYYGRNDKAGSAFYDNYFYTLRNVQVEWRNAYRWSEQHTSTAGFAWNRSQFRTENDGNDLDKSLDNSLENVYGLFAEHRYTPAKNWANTLAVRLDQSSVYDAFFTFRAASSYKFNRERTRAFASLGNGYSAPGSLQRSNSVYHGAWGTYIGNPELKCERSIGFDLGVEHEWMADHHAGLTYFWQQRQDAITTDAANRYTNNSGHWTSQGFEASLRGTWEKHWNTGYTVAYTLTQPIAGEADRQIPQSARQLWSADIHTSPLAKLTTGIGVTAAVHRTDWGGDTMDNYYTLRWYANYALNDHITLHLRVENLTNQKFATENDWPLDTLNSGIGVFGGCTIQF